MFQTTPLTTITARRAPRTIELDPLYIVRPYYIVPDGNVGHDAFAVIRETIRSMNKVALARVTLHKQRAYHRLRPA